MKQLPRRPSMTKIWSRALRLHQWAKNFLVFVPLILSHSFAQPPALLSAIAAFLSLGMVASATYLVNDLSDLEADRKHPTKRTRPIASGLLSKRQAIMAAGILLATGTTTAAAISLTLLACITFYLGLTLAYTFVLKRRLLVDVVTLASLYCLRVIIGAVAVSVDASVWLLTFSMFFFFSISLAKRYAEIAGGAAGGQVGSLPGRGYIVADAPTVLALGVSSSMASVLLVVLYLTQEAFPSGLYQQPNWLWVVPVVLLVWSARIWLIAGRGHLDEDPVAFAIHDRFSWALVVPLVGAFVAATLA